MREKLLDLMKNEGLKSSQLAEMLGINPAGISHILAGRNKPGFDLLQKILRRFPKISPDWLLLDQGPMYRNEDGGLRSNPELLHDTGTTGIDNGLFGPTNTRTANDLPSDPEFNAGHADQNGKAPDAYASIDRAFGKPDVIVERVIVFYSDRTCESYTPTKR